MKRTQHRTEKPTRKLNSARSGFLDFSTPFDDDIPEVEDPPVRFYIDAMRIYLGIYSNSLSIEDALEAVEVLKENPEFARTPINPALVPMNEDFKNKLLANLQTLKKLNLITKDSVKSAYSFSFLTPDAAVADSDLAVLRILEKNPLIPLVNAAESLGVNPRTIARSIERLESRNMLRFSTQINGTAFGLLSVILFFSLAEGVEWNDIEHGFSMYPFTKAILKTTMTDLGYISFMIPGPQRNYELFKQHILEISPILFSYSSYHSQEAFGSNTAFSYFDGQHWTYPASISEALNTETPYEEEQSRFIQCKPIRKGFTLTDYLVAIEHKLGARNPPRILSRNLRAKGWAIDAKQTANSLRKVNRRDLILPFISISNIGLLTNLCFEIICDNNWKQRVLSATRHIPHSFYFISPRGIIVWAQVPSSQQVEYYQLFRSLEENAGVKSVQPIMTLLQMGSRSEFDFVKYWRYGDQGWTIDSEALNPSPYLLWDE
ncbi:MAG: winged helix-turn-helix transcriptional regulator [Promethearchaeota archaeon]